MTDDSRVLHRGSNRYLLVKRGGSAAGERVPLPDRASARAFLAALAAEPGNREALRAASSKCGLTGGVPSGYGGRPDEDAWAPLTDALARGSLEVIRLIDHPVSLCHVTTTGNLTLSEVSWGETSGIYPGKDHLYQPDRWDQARLCDLLKARSAVNDVASRNNDVRKAKPSKGNIDQMLRPYHCVENFPPVDREITAAVKWFYLSSTQNAPTSHPGTTGTVLVKSYGPFYNIGGGDVPAGAVYLLFYALG